MKKLLTVLLSVLMVLTLGIVNVSAEEDKVAADSIDVNNVNYTLITAEAKSNVYNGKRQGSEINFKTVFTGKDVDGLDKFDIDLEELKDIKNREDLAKFLVEHAFKGAFSDYVVVYTQKNKAGQDVIVEPKDAGTYTATIVLRPVTALTDCSFLRNEGGFWFLSQVKHVDYVINPSDDFTVVAPTAKKDLTVNSSDQPLLASKGSATTFEGNDLPMEYSLDNEHWSAEMPTGKAAKTYTVYYRVNANKTLDGYDTNFVDYNGSYNGSIDVTIKPTPVRPYTPVVTGC